MTIWAASVETCRTMCPENTARGECQVSRAAAMPEACPSVEPGTVVEVTKNTIKIVTGEGLLCINELQLEGKKRMSTHDFLLGVKVRPGEKFA